jgi:hypothetical protein
MMQIVVDSPFFDDIQKRLSDLETAVKSINDELHPKAVSATLEIVPLPNQ